MVAMSPETLQVEFSNHKDVFKYQGLDEDGWALSYHLENQMMQIIEEEEEYRRQRDRQDWLLKGDANTAYFHAMANGR